MDNLKGTALFLTLTGGGSIFISDTLTAGGASSFFEGCEIPYSIEQLDQVIGFTPEKYTSDGVLVRLAENSLKKISNSKKIKIGVGATSVLNVVGGQREGRKNFIKIMVLIVGENNEKSKAFYSEKVDLDPDLSRMDQEKKCSKIIKDVLSGIIVKKDLDI